MYTYYTELDIEECKKRINDEIKKNRFIVGEIRGRVNFKRNKFWLLKPIYNNSIESCFDGEMVTKEQGTIIYGTFNAGIFYKIFDVFCYTILIFISLLCLRDFFLGNLDNTISALIVIPFMFILSIHGTKVKIRNGKKGEKYVLELIKTKLEAKEVKITN